MVLYYASSYLLMYQNAYLASKWCISPCAKSNYCVYVCVQACMCASVCPSLCEIFHPLQIKQAEVHDISLFWLSLNSYNLLLNIQGYNLSACSQMSK